jgi:rhamnose transport system permease protein
MFLEDSGDRNVLAEERSCTNHPSSPARNTIMSRIWRAYRRELILLGLLIISLIVIGVRAPSYISLKTLDTIWHDSVLLILLALVQMPIIMSRGIDLSVAANLALSGMLVSLLGQQFPSLQVIVLLPLGALIGLALGTLNAALINGLELPPIVATLGTMSVYRGMIYVVSGGQWVNSNELPPALVAFPNARVLGLTNFEWVSIFAVLIAWIVIHQTRFGREVRALGGNPNAARYVGIPASARVFALYAISGAVAGIVGVMWVARYALASTEIALGFELQVVAACVLGGVSIAGGVGTVFGTVLGAIFLVTLYNALPVIGVSPFWQMAIVGVAILVAAVVNQGQERRKGKQILKRAISSEQRLAIGD